MNEQVRDDKFFVKSIFHEISMIEKFSENLTKEKFEQNLEKQYAIFKAFENIGEAANNLSDELKKQNPNIPWKKIIGFRNELTHGYFGINTDLVWNTIINYLPEMKKQLLPELYNSIQIRNEYYLNSFKNYPDRGIEILAEMGIAVKYLADRQDLTPIQKIQVAEMMNSKGFSLIWSEKVPVADKVRAAEHLADPIRGVQLTPVQQGLVQLVNPNKSAEKGLSR